MTHEERLTFCKNCKNRELNQQLDIICGITKSIPAFENACENYAQETTPVREPAFDGTIEYVVDDLSDEIKNKFREQQDIVYAVVGATAAAMVGAVLWALVTVTTKYQIGYMAIGVGALVGFGVRFYGAGIDKIFGVIGVLFALLGCGLGNLLSQVGFITQAQQMSYLEVVSLLSPGIIADVLTEAFAPMDILFYGIAGYEGYRFAFRKISSADLQAITSNQPLAHSFSRFRIPTVIALFVVISLTGFFLYQNSGGQVTYKYDSGATHYQGSIENGLETGLWTYWWENGKIQQKGYFKEGKQDSIWESYNEDGVLYQRSTYKSKNQHGKYEVFYPNGQPSATGQYAYGRQTGLWKFFQPNGALVQQGYYFMDLPDSVWETYYPNGKLKLREVLYRGEPRGIWKYYFENGSIAVESDYGSRGKQIVNNMWAEDGAQLVKNGNGIYVSHHPNGAIHESGKIMNGHRVGIWKTYSTQKKLLEEGEYKEDKHYVINSWSFEGKPMVVNRNGSYENYHDDSTGVVNEAGKILKGIRTREWEVRNRDKVLLQKNNYVNGSLEGKFQSFFETGTVSAEGSFREDKRIDVWTWYHENGAVESSIGFVDGKKDGIQLFFDQDGKTIRTEIYQNGELKNVTLGPK
ncbi:MAG TPA: hypothetical protein VL728_17825 [Cyclobacteriaceae bacterium]|jgi:antitoxin component YwqK of YwqJK toxin-antitoxin module|nr:hypothetical protein [Cyclobacteriaceae bacterium]